MIKSRKLKLNGGLYRFNIALRDEDGIDKILSVYVEESQVELFKKLLKTAQAFYQKFID